MTTLEVLKKARDLISTPDKWTKGAVARDRHGFAVEPYAQMAVCWCSVGALERAVGANLNVYYAAFAVLRKQHDESVVSFNDDPNTTHQDVLDLFDRTIKSLLPA